MRDIRFKLSLIKAIVAREAPLINFASFDAALFSPLRDRSREKWRRNTNVADEGERNGREWERNGAGERSRAAKAEVACCNRLSAGNPLWSSAHGRWSPRYFIANWVLTTWVELNAAAECVARTLFHRRLSFACVHSSLPSRLLLSFSLFRPSFRAAISLREPRRRVNHAGF